MNDRNASSELVTDLTTEICYQINESFFIGNPNDPSEFQNTELNVALTPLKIDRKTNEIVTTKEVLGKELQLFEYYKSIIELKDKHQKTYNEIHHLFWLRLWIYSSKERIYISFPWYDTLNEFKRFFRVFDKDSTGKVFYDVDQGWELEIQADNDFYYIKQTNPDENDLVIQNIKTSKIALKNTIAALEKTIDGQIEKLTQLAGVDLWTDRGYLNEEKNIKNFKKIDIKTHNKNQLRNIKKNLNRSKQKKNRNFIITSAWILLFVLYILSLRELISWIIPAIILGIVLIESFINNNKN